MAESSSVPDQPQNRPTPVEEIDVLWLTAGLGCDGDTIAVTGATQPSIEDLVLGSFPWIPKVRFHNPFLAYENGDEFVKSFRRWRGGEASAIYSGGGRLDSQREEQVRGILGVLRNRSKRPASRSRPAIGSTG
jgi:hypothetical protein